MDSFNYTNWDDLLHIHQESNEVVSPEWYLSANRTSSSEYDEFTKLIQGPHSQFYVCEFPARFKSIEKKFNLESKHLLNNCPDISLFKTNFDKKYISVALTSEHLSAPASAFGHVMMVFHDHQEIELNASVLHFSALTQNESFFRYATNGIAGIFSGYYFYEPFFKKLNEYSEIEQRSIYAHQLLLSNEQKELLILHLFELKKARFKYSFFTKNCGYQINNLLNLIYNKSENIPLIYFLPREVLDNHKEHLTSGHVIRPLASRARAALKILKENELQDFKKVISDGEVPNDNFSEPTKAALYLYNKYLFRNKRIITYHFNEISNISMQNEDVKNLYEESISPIDLSTPRKIQLGLEHSSQKTNYLLSYRPILLDSTDFQYYKQSESTFNILKTELLINRKQIALKRLDLLDLKLAPPTYPYFREASWSFNSSFNRENLNESLSLSHSFGIGQTFDLGFKLSYYLGAGFDFENMEKGRAYLLGVLGSHVYIYKENKLIYESKFKFYKKTMLDIHDITLIRNFHNLDFYTGYTIAEENRINLGLYYHF